MGETIFHLNGADICSETFGNATDEAMLLIMGASASMVWWPDAFCQRLADAGFCVIRYDNRDTGRSTTYPPGQPDYSIDNLADDAAALLDAHGIERAHVAGMSLGGMIGQILALSRPERVLSLSFLMSSIFGAPSSKPPAIYEKILEYHKSAAALDWHDRDAVVNYAAGGWRLLAGSAHAFDEKAVRAMAGRDFDRARSLPSMFNHAMLKGGEGWYGRIGEIEKPTVVLQGTEDPVQPYELGFELATTIHGARLVPLPGTGHEIHQADWDQIVSAMVKVAAKAQPTSAFASRA